MRRILAILLLVGLAAVLVGVHFIQFSQRAEADAFFRMARDEAILIQQQVETFREIVRSLANSQTAKDILHFSAPQEGLEWALKNRQLLPSSVGLALLDHKGNVLGDPPQLRIGPDCQQDLHLLMQAKPVSPVPVHFNNPKLKHFDLVETVRGDDGETLGLVFASFKLSTLQTLVNKLTRADTDINIRLRTRFNEVIAERWAHSFSNPLSAAVPIPGTDWTLEIQAAKTSIKSLVLNVSLVGLTTFVVISLMLLSLRQRLVRVLQHDFQQIQHELDYLRGEASSATSDDALALQETRALVQQLHETLDLLRQHHQELIGLGLTDELTNMPNRRHFNERFPFYVDLLAKGHKVAVLLLDLDNFKRVNDELGHEAGDELLRMLVSSLKANLREQDFAARLGGDEFVLVLLDMDEQEARGWFRKMQDHFKQLQQQNKHFQGFQPVGTSGGMAWLSPDKQDRKQVLAEADAALYRSKAAGKGRLSFQV